MTNIDFASLPDAEAARLIAEREGYKFVGGGTWVCPKGHRVGEDTFTYPRSLDAAVGWLGRMGLEWCRVTHSDGGFYVLVWRASNYQCYGETVYESPTCSTERALCNAGWAAVQAREAEHG